MLEIRLLGQFSVVRDGEPVSIPTRNGQALFAFLVLNAGASFRREHLAGLFWPESAEENARSNLRHELWRLRKALDSDAETTLSADDLSISFNPSRPYDLDVHRFEMDPQSQSSPDALMKAVSVYEGELLPGFYNEWIFAERERLAALYETRMARLLELLEIEGRWQEIQDWTLRWIAQGRLPETAYRALIEAQANSGDVARAMSTYERYAKALQQELGAKPSEQTMALYRRLRSGWRQPAPPGAAGSAELKEEARGERPRMSTRPFPPARSNLPRPLTSFIGRETEIEQVKRLVASGRLVTITGTGGVGKTRLAIEAAGQLLQRFEHGVFWVELAPFSVSNDSVQALDQHFPIERRSITGPDMVAQVIARVLRLPEVPDLLPVEWLSDGLAGKDVLLVLDNCEHLIEPCARLVEILLVSCPRVSILATSREPLGVPGEKAWYLPSLSLPEPDGMAENFSLDRSESVRLFIERTKDILSRFAPDAAETRTIGEICLRLDGIPLAIELAAARRGLLSSQEIAARLDSRFNLLTAGTRTALPRHQTLRAAIEWSYDLLEDQENTLFRRLSVFPGTFTLESAESICVGDGIEAADVLTTLGKLVGKSLVHISAHDPGSDARTRYYLLESLRDFGRLELDSGNDAARLRERHAEHYLGLVEEIEPKLSQSDQARWYRHLQDENHNIRRVIEWSVQSNRPEIGLRMVGALLWFWWSHSSAQEGLDLALKALSIPAADQYPRFKGSALNTAAYLLWTLGDNDSARRLLEEAKETAAEAQDEAVLSRTLQLLGLVFMADARSDLAVQSMRAGLEIARSLGDLGKSSFTLAFLGDAVLGQGDLVKARQAYEETSEILHSLGNYLFYAYPQRRLGYLSLTEGAFERANGYFTESLEQNAEAGDRRAIAACLVAFSALALGIDAPDQAARLYGAAYHLLDSIDANLLITDRLEAEKVRQGLVGKLGEARLEAEHAAGWQLSLGEAIQLTRIIQIPPGPSHA